MTDSQEAAARYSEDGCITLIGMAGAGKSTVGRVLAERFGWRLVDTDHLIEAHYGASLQAIADRMSKDEFLDVEAQIVGRVGVKRSIIATGGSVIYRHATMEHLKRLGPVIHLDVELPTILTRISRNPDRGLAIAPGQTIEDLYNERKALYSRYSDYSLCCTSLSPAQCVSDIVAWLENTSE